MASAALTQKKEVMTQVTAGGATDGATEGKVQQDDRVFSGFAQVWAETSTDLALTQSLLTDPHPPGRSRTDIPTRNINAWYDAFSVTSGENYLNPSDRVVIW